MLVMPAMPVPMIAAVRGPARASREMPDCATASSAATSKYCVTGIQKRDQLFVEIRRRDEILDLRGDFDASLMRPREAGLDHTGAAIARGLP